MIFITGDTHGRFDRIEYFVNEFKTNKNDLLIILGDAGINYNLNNHDVWLKRWLNNINITFLCVRGNHEERPENIKTYKKERVDNQLFRATCFVEYEYPSLYFLDNGPITIKNNKTDLEGYVINGAYSVDKYYRLTFGAKWFADEQLTKTEKEAIYTNIPEKLDFILSHTCPEKYIPTEMFLKGLDQSSVDRSMEEFLDKIEDKVNYNKWYCGHWHCDKRIDNMQFLFNDIIEMKNEKEGYHD